MTDRDVTVIYYTSNRESPEFEAKVRDQLLRVTGDLPIVSVSHKPIDLGYNICVGEQYPCDANLYRQLYIGCEAATTRYVINAEADFLYPPEYFSFTPTETDTLYRFMNVWILFKWRGEYYRKEYSEGAQIGDRRFIMDRIDLTLQGRPYWSGPDDPKIPEVYKKRRWLTFTSDNPAVSVKTGDGLRAVCGTMKDYPSVTALPYWGSCLDVKRWLFGLQD